MSATFSNGAIGVDSVVIVVDSVVDGSICNSLLALGFGNAAALFLDALLYCSFALGSSFAVGSLAVVRCFMMYAVKYGAMSNTVDIVVLMMLGRRPECLSIIERIAL